MNALASLVSRGLVDHDRARVGACRRSSFRIRVPEIRSQHMPTVFVYGALMVDHFVLEHGRAAQADGFEVAFVMDGIPVVEPRFAGLIEAEGGVAHGVVCDLDDATWKRISAHEAGYRRDTIDVDTERGRERALALVATSRYRVEVGPPSRRYARMLAKGADAHGLPAEVCDRYRALAETGPRASTFFPWLPKLMGRAVGKIGLRPALALLVATLALVVTGLVFAVSWLVG